MGIDKKDFIYISGPMTGVENYEHNFFIAENHLINKGYVYIVNPARFNAQLPEALIHEQFMVIDIAALSICNVIYMLKGWENSKGAKIEYQYAIDNGIKILFE